MFYMTMDKNDAEHILILISQLFCGLIKINIIASLNLTQLFTDNCLTGYI